LDFDLADQYGEFKVWDRLLLLDLT
jgi:hypothetical protein